MKYKTNLRFIAVLLVVAMFMPLMWVEKYSDAASAKKYRNVAYFTSWSGYARGMEVSDIDASLLTHINFAFANLKSSGEIVVGDSWIDTDKPFGNDSPSGKSGTMGHFKQLRLLKKKNPDLKTLISVGGWTWSSNFSDVAASKTKREKFAKSAVKFITKYGFDGIDIDWEYPVTGGDNIKHRKADKTNYTKLLAAIRKQLNAQSKKDGKKYLLTIAGGANVSFTKNTEIKKIMKYVDWINIMTYDYHGGWESVTNHNAPLYINSKDPTKNQSYCVSTTVDSYIKAGALPSKLNLGLAFFGRGWTNVKNKSHGLFQKGTVPYGTGKGSGTWEGGTFDYWDLEKNYINKNGYKRYYDKQAQVPYLYNGKTFITYDDKQSIEAKMDYVIKKGLGGAMFWEFSGDKNKKLQKVIANKLKINK